VLVWLQCCRGGLVVDSGVSHDCRATVFRCWSRIRLVLHQHCCAARSHKVTLFLDSVSGFTLELERRILSMFTKMLGDEIVPLTLKIDMHDLMAHAVHHHAGDSSAKQVIAKEKFVPAQLGAVQMERLRGDPGKSRHSHMPQRRRCCQTFRCAQNLLRTRLVQVVGR
jgi:hypothetical protein